MWQHDSNSMQLYRTMKLDWGEEPYLTTMSNPAARRYLAQMRTSTAPLRALLHHHGLADSPLCLHCDMQAEDDQAHVLWSCPAYQAPREHLLRVARLEWERNMVAEWAHAGPDERTSWVLGWLPVCRAVGEYLVAVFAIRARLEHAASLSATAHASPSPPSGW
jgi:hypothetical protein